MARWGEARGVICLISQIHHDAAFGVFEGLMDSEAELFAHVLHLFVFENSNNNMLVLVLN
jgi:hypothetical protein